MSRDKEEMMMVANNDALIVPFAECTDDMCIARLAG
jgi:hypothetical protein